MKRKKRVGIIQSLYRYIYYKLIIPIKREKRGPEYIARGTAIGLFCGFSPIVWQMNIVIIIWIIAKRFKWHFSLPISLAWTWVSNTFTNIPLFYIYYMLGSLIYTSSPINGYYEFITLFDNGVINGVKDIVNKLGIPILIGSFIIMIISSIFGYIISYHIVARHQKYLLNKNIKKPH